MRARWLAMLISVAGCYRPAADVSCAITCDVQVGCPGTMRCGLHGLCVAAEDDDGVCPLPGDGGSSDGAPSDGAPSDGTPPPTSCTVPNFNGFQGLVDAESFSPALSAGFAARLVGSDGESPMISVTEIGVESADNAYKVVVTVSATGERLATPRLAANGDQIIYHHVTSVLMRTLQVVTRNGPGIWSPPAEITLQFSFVPRAIDQFTHPSAPTSTSPRRMMVTQMDGFSEYVESAMPNVWQQGGLYTAAIPFGLTFITEPNLTSDGLRLVFVGVASGGDEQIYLAEREDLGNPFMNAIPIFDAPSSTGSPYLSSNCQQLYYVDTAASRAMRVMQ